MEKVVEIQHVLLEIDADFDNFTRAIEQSLGQFEDVLLKDLDTAPSKTVELLKKAAGEEDMMLFKILDHGKLLNIFGSPKKAKQYVLGNPAIAAEMTRHDIRAALYAPLRLLVYEAGPNIRIEYDRPSSIFKQFDNAEVTAVAFSLDEKLANLIKKSAYMAREICKSED